MLKELILSKNKKNKKKYLQNQPQTVKKMARTAIYICNYFKGKWIKCSTKRHRLDEWIQKKKTHVHAVYKKPNSDLRYRLQGRGWKNIFHANGKQRQLE